MKIILHLDVREIKQSRLVCKSWDNLYKTEIGPNVTITNQTLEILNYLTRNFEIIQQLSVSDLTFPMKSVTEPSPYQPIRVCKLNFHRITLSRNLLFSLQYFSNLKQLSFSCVIMDKMNKEALEGQPFPLKQLHSLNIYSKTGDSVDVDDLMLLDGHFGFPRDELALLNFLAQLDYEKLSTIKLFCSAKAIESLPLEQLAPHPPLSPVDGGPNGLIRLLRSNNKSLKQFWVGESPIRCILNLAFRPQAEAGLKITVFDSTIEIPVAWGSLFSGQQQLQLVRAYNACENWDYIMDGVKCSGDQIQEVNLVGRFERGSTLDLEAMGSCRQLELLSMLLQNIYMRNINKLPESIKLLRLKGPLTSQDLVSISRLANLQCFVLESNFAPIFIEDQVVIPATITPELLTYFLSSSKVCQLLLRACTIDVAGVEDWLKRRNHIIKYSIYVYDKPLNLFEEALKIGDLDIRFLRMSLDL